MKYIVNIDESKLKELDLPKSALEARLKVEEGILSKEEPGSLFDKWLSSEYDRGEDWYWSDAVLHVENSDTCDVSGVLYTVTPEEALRHLKEGLPVQGVFLRISEERYLKNANFTEHWIAAGGKIAIEGIEREADLLAEVAERGQSKSVHMVGGYLMIPTGEVALGYYGEPQSKFFFMDDYLIGEELWVDFDDVELRPKQLSAKSTGAKSGKKSGGTKKPSGIKSAGSAKGSAKGKASSKNLRKMAMLRLMMGK